MKQYILEENKEIQVEDISKDDKLEDCIRKVFIIRRKLSNHSTKDEDRQDYLQIFDVYAKIVYDAYIKYPNDALLNSLYAEVVLDIRHNYKYTDDNNRFSDIIYNMLPFIQENNDVPRVALTMFFLFDFLEINLPNTCFYTRYVKTATNAYYENVSKDDKDALVCNSPYTHIYRLFGITSNQDEKGVLTLLKNYWASKINPTDIDTPGIKKEAIEAHNFIKIEGNSSKAEKAWQMVMDAVINDHEKHANNNPQNKSIKPVLKMQPKVVNDNLAELETNHKMDFVEIQSFFGNRLRAFKNELKDKPDLPNIDKIKASNSEWEATVLNLWYKFSIHGRTQDVYDAVGATNGWEKESRLVALRMICARELNRPKEEVVELCDALVKLEPNNQIYRHARLSLDAPQAPAYHAAQKAQSSYLVELQRRGFANVEEALKELETKRKWELDAIEIFMSKLSAYRKELRGSLDLPNLEKIRISLTEPEAFMLNLWFKYSIHRSYHDIYDSIDKIEAWEKDTRLVFLKLLCGRRLNREKAELLKLCDMLVELEPDNQRFKHARLSLEMN